MEDTSTPSSSAVPAALEPSSSLANTAPTSPSDPVLEHYTRLLAALLSDPIVDGPDGSAGGANGSDSNPSGGSTSWSTLREQIEVPHRTPFEWARTVAGSLARAEEDARRLLRGLQQRGTAKVAEECLALDLEALSSAEGARASTGLVAMAQWVGVAKAVLEGTDSPLPDFTATNGSHYVDPSSGHHDSLTLPFGYAEPSSADAPPQFVSPSEVSGPSPTLATAAPVAPSSIVPDHSVPGAGFAPPPPAGGMAAQKSSSPASTAAPHSIFPSASTSTSLPIHNGPIAPSPGFAPPPAAGAMPKPKKSRSSTGASRRTSMGVVKAKGASEVYHPPSPVGDSSRPQRKRKLPKTLTFEQSSDPFDDDGGSSTGPPAKKAKGKGKAKAPPPPPDEEEIDELASDYEEQYGSGRSVSVEQHQHQQVKEEEEDGERFKVGEAVMAKYPNYGPFPSIVLDPRTPPSNTQGKRVKGAYLVKSIPTGADHRWVPPEEPHIRAITSAELDEIEAGKYAVAPPKSWTKYRPDLLEAAKLIRNPEDLKDWASRPTDLETRIAAEEERKRLAKATSAW